MNKPPPLDAKVMGLVAPEQDPLRALPPDVREAVVTLVTQQIRGKRETAGISSKTLSTKVDPELYQRILNARAATQRSWQEISVEATEAWLKKNHF